jgi:hypothetical protein
MDAQRFDHLAKTRSAPGTRRALLRRLAAVPVACAGSRACGRALERPSARVFQPVSMPLRATTEV